MRFLLICALPAFLAACSSNPLPEDDASQKITITGQRIQRSEISPGPKLSMSVNKKNKSSNFMQAFAGMKSLPQPKDIGDCIGLLNALDKASLDIQIVDKNNAVLETEHGIYHYSFDDNSCPTNET